MRPGVMNGGAAYDMDDLEVYDGIVESIEEGDYTQKDVAEDYGKFEAVNLLGEGTIVDHNERELNIRESRIPEADRSAEHMNNGLKDAGKAAAYTAGLTALPAGTGYMAIESGGEPFWVFGSMFSTAMFAESITNGAKQAVEGVVRRAVKSKVGRSYDFGAVAEEDYELNLVDDAEFQEMAFEYDDDEDVEVRQPKVIVGAGRVNPQTGEVEMEEEPLTPEEEQELREDMLEPEDDEFE